MKFLVTGGAGYIGSTVCSALLDAGHTPVILDNLATGKRDFTLGRIFYEGDIADTALLSRIFEDHPDISACLHFAALIIVPDSMERPFEYYTENVSKSILLFDALRKLGCKKIIFSSSASLYDVVPGFMVTENSPLKPSSPYARTKFMMEMILRDMCKAYRLQGIALRYFNPIGADPKMRTGAHAKNASHVVGKLVAVARGQEDVFQLTGVDWPTRDGSGIRDYIHVWDLALAHVAAAEKFDDAFKKSSKSHYLVINLGTGNGVTVKELVAAFERVWGKTLRKMETAPRPGDVAGAYANADVAKALLGWQAQNSIDEGIQTALSWAEKIQNKSLQ